MFYPISSSYVSVVIIRKHWKQEHWKQERWKQEHWKQEHWKQEHWRYIVGNFLGFSNCRGFFKDFQI